MDFVFLANFISRIFFATFLSSAVGPWPDAWQATAIGDSSEGRTAVSSQIPLCSLFYECLCLFPFQDSQIQSWFLCPILYLCAVLCDGVRCSARLPLENTCPEHHCLHRLAIYKTGFLRCYKQTENYSNLFLASQTCYYYSHQLPSTNNSSASQPPRCLATTATTF